MPAAMIRRTGAVSAESCSSAGGWNSTSHRKHTGELESPALQGRVAARPVPVGLVHIALADGRTPVERGMNFPGDRERVRWQATQTALDLVRRHFIYAGGKHSGPKS